MGGDYTCRPPITRAQKAGRGADEYRGAACGPPLDVRNEAHAMAGDAGAICSLYVKIIRAWCALAVTSGSYE
jgi:hypothetical protein